MASVDPSGIVSFEGKGLKWDTEEDAKDVINSINTHQSDLHTLILEGNTLGIPAARAIGAALESASGLKRALFKDLFTGRLKTEVPVAVELLANGIMKSGATLTELDLSDNAFGPIGIKALAPFLKSEACQDLEVLKLHNNGNGIQGGTLLAGCLPLLKKLRVFISGRNRLENDASILIGKSLSQLENLEVLEMPQNGIRFEGIASLSNAVRCNKRLRVLNLNDNIFTEKGGEAMAESLAGATEIEIINFGDCLLRPNGGVFIIQALMEQIKRDTKSLKEVILTGNELGGSEVMNLLYNFSRLKSLMNPDLTLDLSCNSFGDDVVDLLLDHFEQENVHVIIEDDEGLDDGDENEDDDDENYEDEEDEGEVVESRDDNGAAEWVNVDVDGQCVSSPKKYPEIEKKLQENLAVADLCDLFVNVCIENFDEKSGKLDDGTLQTTSEILATAKRRSSNSFEVPNSLLTSLGLLKKEDEKKPIAKDLRGPFYALASDTKCLDKNDKEVLTLFVGMRSNPASDSAGRFKHQLLQSLHK